MSTPVDIPQNINIHVTHLDRVVEAPKTNIAENSADRSSLEMANRETEHKHLVHKKEQDKEKERENKKQDHFEKQSFQQHAGTREGPSMEVGPDTKQVDESEFKDVQDIGKKIDFSF